MIVRIHKPGQLLSIISEQGSNPISIPRLPGKITFSEALVAPPTPAGDSTYRRMSFPVKDPRVRTSMYV